ncbi:hypothetical protein C6503_20635 [Candidatus Poribacteria bacterium]|nr:MAG: hypothetical protein C6503_20635 [Candidatus Poribacteria bacterium]
MRKFQWLMIVLLIGGVVAFASCRRMERMIVPVMPDAEQVEPTEMPPEMVETPMEPEPPEMPIDLVDVLIYTNRSYWITLEDAAMAAETTRNLVASGGFSVEITKDPAHVSKWMLQTTGDGNVNVIILYGVLPDSVYGAGNSQPDGSIAENWVETTDGDTILNHADYIAWNSDFEVGEVTGIVRTEDVGVNQEGGLQNLMDNPTISLRDNRNVMAPKTMVVTSDGMALAPSLVDFVSHRSVQLDQLQGEWVAEKIFASDTGNDQAACADPVVLRDGDRGRIAIIHGTFEHAGLLNGEVAAEIIINYLLAPPMMETVEPPTEPMEPPEPIEMPTQANLTDRLVLHLSFDEDTIQGNIVKDQSGEGNDGIINGAAQTVPGKHGEAMEFDGTDDFVEVPLIDSITFSTGDSLTVQAWVKTDDAPRWNDIIVGNYRYGTTAHWSLYVSGDNPETRGKMGFNVWDKKGAHATVGSPDFLNDGEWHLLTGVRDQTAKKVRFYVDGELIGEVDDTTEDINSEQSIWIGEHLNRYYKGLIDEVKIWSRPLTAEEIQQSQ